MGLKVIPVTHLSRTHVAVGGRKQGRPSSIEPKEKEGCPGHEWKTYKGPHPALDFKYCKVCHEVIWLPPDRMW